jgi:hypothetical protein
MLSNAIFRVALFDHALFSLGAFLIGWQYGWKMGLAAWLICEALYHPGMVERA